MEISTGARWREINASLAAVREPRALEQHDGAYAIGRDAGVKSRVLIHIDAHHDLYGRWFDKKRPGGARRNLDHPGRARRNCKGVAPDDPGVAGDEAGVDVGPERVTGMALGRALAMHGRWGIANWVKIRGRSSLFAPIDAPVLVEVR